MSRKSESIGPIPQETARVAKAACPQGSTFMKMRDILGVLFEDEMFAGLFPHDGQPALAPWRLALILIMQFVEGLADRQAAEAVRTRIDWKYALGLELEDEGFDFSVLCEFRARLIEGHAAYLLFEAMLTYLKQQGLDLCRRATADRCNACTSCRAGHESCRLCRRDLACRAQYTGRSCPEVAALLRSG
jgi:transposase